MTRETQSIPRRAMLGGLSAAFFMTPGLFAEQLFPTPAMTEGPFYPDKLPLDQDNDLIKVNDRVTPAIGEITHLTGRILNAAGEPIKNATIEIWQCDGNGVYLHSADSGPRKAQQDQNFQGYGKFTTDSTGEYRFRTIKPVPYPGRPAPHIHVMVKRGDRELLTTQLFIRNHPNNAKDGIFNSVRDLLDRELVLADFTPIKSSKIGELSAVFDVVVGMTPSEEKLERRPNRKG